ncbi:MAG: choice-of-anchor A family protein [Akkermansiaceae bacterium]|nr:choice-of-anchor A family protein [Akkermansiaceae bacterium]MCP5545391.1 choice-of-anchor A family protein [Akkermansiaceae bacterium]MCP5548061.1 choice-of-anchor A family protein [Akkermansiaceae bacterium]
MISHRSALHLSSPPFKRRGSHFRKGRSSGTLVALMAPVALLVLPASGANTALDIIGRFNLIAGDYNAGNETEGSAFIYGNYNPSTQSRFGFNGGQAANDSEYMLWLNNGVNNSNSTTLITGSVLSRVAVNSSQFTLNGNAPGTPVITTGEAAWENELTSQLGINTTAEFVGILSDASSQWAALDVNSTASLPGNGGLSFNAAPTNIDGYQVAVFNVTAAQLSDNTISRYDLFLNGANTVLINVSGTTVNINKSFTGDFTNNENKVIFNFFEAETVTITNNARAGIFAPFASVIQSGSNIDGSVIAASFSQTAEVHDKRFDAYLPYAAAIPEPSTVLLTAAGLGVLLRRRRTV